MYMKELVIPFATGLFIFLFGMQVMRIGFENMFFDKVKKWLRILTHSPWMGLITGTLTTAVLQSSSAVMLLTIGLVHAKVLSFRNAIGIILGTNIGTVVTIEVLATNLYYIEFYLFFIGLLLFMFPHMVVRCTGMIMGGFGLLFIGMETMQSITPMLKTLGWLDTFYDQGSAGVWNGVLLGTFVTALIQSSTATTMMAMNLIHDQLLPLGIAIAISLGSNIGTCFTAILGSIGTNIEARQSAVAHLILNVGGVLLVIPFIPALEIIVTHLTANPMQQIAHAQLIFNIVCSLLVLPFVHYFERLVIFCTPRQSD